MSKINAKPVKVFSREEPCTKVDLHNCFYLGGGAPLSRAVVEARGEIGLNAIKYLKREGYAIEHETDGVDYWTLTPEGVEWLRKGLARHLELHPADASLVMRSRAGSTGPVRRRRTR